MKPALPGEEELAETTLRSTMPMRNFSWPRQNCDRRSESCNSVALQSRSILRYYRSVGVNNCSRTFQVVDCPGVSVTMPVFWLPHTLLNGSPRLYCSSRATNGLSFGA